MQRLIRLAVRLARIVALRLAIAIPILFIVSLGAFALLLLLPGEPALALAGGMNATPEDVERVREQLGLDDPFFEQYFRWLGDAIRLDFGHSIVNPEQEVWGQIKDKIPRTLSMGLFGVVSSVVIGLAAGTVAGARPGTRADKFSIGMATVGVSVPSFVIAIFLIRAVSLEWELFNVENALVIAVLAAVIVAAIRGGTAIERARRGLISGAGWFVGLLVFQWLILGRNLLPAVNYVDFGESITGWLKSIALPGLALGLLPAAALSRQLRSGLVDSANADYVRTAWSVGSGRSSAIGKHALRNSAIPSVAVLGSQMTVLLGGTVVIERLFNIRGVGTYMIDSTLASDLPAIRGVIMWYALIQLAVYLLIDVALVLLNPRLEVR